MAMSLGLACTAADAIPHVTNVRLLSLEGQLVLPQEMLFVNSVIDEIPREVLIQPLRPVDEEIRIDLTVKEGLLPVLSMNMGKKEHGSHTPITQREQRLQISPLRQVETHLDAGDIGNARA
jgi:hypothetical protein